MFDLLGLFIWITSFLQVQVIVWILLRSLEERYFIQNIIVIYNLVATWILNNTLQFGKE